MAAGIPESIENLRKMLGLLKLASIDCSFTVDLKLGNNLAIYIFHLKGEKYWKKQKRQEKRRDKIILINVGT